MADRELNYVVKGKDEASGPFGKVRKSLDEMGDSSRGLKGKLGDLGGGLLHFGKIAGALAIGGIAALAAGLGFAAKQAIEEEASIAKLTTVLSTNAVGWDGNMEAVDKALLANQNFSGFADDQLRESLGILTTFTKDLTKAQDLQALAMDFARLKGIDLATASEIVGKVSEGNTGILSRYGISVDKGATATEALAAMQTASAGQAEAYGNTTAGAFDKFQNSMNDVVEDIGAALLPIMADLATFLNETVIPTVKDIAGRITDWFEDNKELIGQIRDFLIPIIEGIGAVIQTVIDTAVPIIRDVFIPAIQAIWDVVSKVIDIFSDLFDDIIKPAVDAILPPLRTVLDGIAGAFKILFDAVDTLLGPLRTVIGLAEDAIALLIELSRMTGPSKEQQQAAYDEWKRANPGKTLPAAEAAGLRAAGGPVMAGGRYIVGERGPEWFVPRTSGSIIPNSGGGGVVNIASGAIVIYGGRDSADQIAAKTLLKLERRMTRSGIPALRPR